MGNIKIFRLPHLNELDSFEFGACSSNSHEARTPRDAKKRDDGLVRESGTKAINNIISSLKNFFAKKGYIYEMKNNGDKFIIKTTLGTNFGAKEGEDVRIYTIEEFQNSLTGKITTTEVEIGKGKISNQLNKG